MKEPHKGVTRPKKSLQESLMRKTGTYGINEGKGKAIRLFYSTDLLNQMPYVASKHAVSAMAGNAVLEFGRFGIITNVIAPGAIFTLW